MAKLKHQLLLMLILLFCWVLSVSAEIFTGSCGKDVNYRLNTETRELVISGTGPMDDYTIVGPRAPWYDNRNYISYVKISYGVSSISNYAFYDCSNMINISMPNTIKEIGESAFRNCSNLKSIPLSNQLESIGTYAFWNCSSMNTITIPKNVVFIGNYVFIDCNNLKEIVWNAENCQDFDKPPFYNASPTPLTNITFGNGVINIPAYLCAYSQIESLLIPNTVASIGKNAFAGCSMLENVGIPSSIKIIGEGAFNGCTNMKLSKLPYNLEIIGTWAFAFCDGLNEISIPASVTKMSDEVFMYCKNLKKVDFLGNVIDFGAGMFECCSSLEEVRLPNNLTNIGIYTFVDCKNLCKIDIPNSVTSIDDYAFSGCTMLPSIIIPGNVKNIGEKAFSGCNNLMNVTNLSDTPQSLGYNNTFPKYGTLHLLKGNKAAYESRSYWRNFAIMEDAGDDAYITEGVKQYSNYIEHDCTSISYTRTFNNTNWQALYVPFAMSYNDWKNDFEVAEIADVQQYDDDSDGKADRTKIEARKLEAGESTTANTPYFIKAKTTGAKTITIADATLYATAENTVNKKSMNTDFDFTGTYTKVTNMATKNYYAMSDGKLCQAESNAATLNPFRWYLSVKDSNGNNVALAKMVSVVFDEEDNTTDVNVVEAESMIEDNRIFTIDGRFVGTDIKALGKGLYIKNKKAFTVK